MSGSVKKRIVIWGKRRRSTTIKDGLVQKRISAFAVNTVVGGGQLGGHIKPSEFNSLGITGVKRKLDSAADEMTVGKKKVCNGLDPKT
jgi:hypothetical protein